MNKKCKNCNHSQGWHKGKCSFSDCTCEKFEFKLEYEPGLPFRYYPSTNRFKVKKHRLKTQLLSKKGIELSKIGNNESYYIHCKKCRDRNYLIECACGCGTIRPIKSRGNHYTMFMSGHYSKLKYKVVQ